MDALGDILKKAQPARLIPVVADARKEERLVSILLATLCSVRPFAEEFLERCGERFGKASVLSGYAEVWFPASNEGSKDRPDGVLRLTSRKAQWTALLEAKIDNAEIDQEQINRYAELARKYSIDAVITVSNQLVPLPTHVPYTIPARSNVQFFHISWVSILTQAKLILRNREDIDPNQAFILGEVERYLDHASSGVRHFEQMNPEWRPLVLGIRDGQQFKRSSPEIEKTVASWLQEERDVCLRLSRLTGEYVGIRGLTRKNRTDPAHRLRNACEALVESKELRSTFSIPNAANEIEVIADLKSRTISCSMSLNAPLDRKRATSKINWLRQQLRGVDSENVRIRAFWPGRALPTQASLLEVRADAASLEHDRRGMVPHGFEVLMITDVAGRFSGRRTFIEDLERAVPEFYDKVGQHLRLWTPAPPSIVEEEAVQDRDTSEADHRRQDNHSPPMGRESPSEGSPDTRIPSDQGDDAAALESPARPPWYRLPEDVDKGDT